MYPQADLDHISRQVIKCATLTGAESTIELLAGWANGEPLTYTEVIVLDGIYQEEEYIEIQQGVRLMQLGSRRQLPVSVQENIVRQVSIEAGLGIQATMLHIDVSATPSILTAEEGRKYPHETPSVDKTKALDSPGLLLQALSLSLDASVKPTHSWISFDERVTLLTGCVNLLESYPHIEDLDYFPSTLEQDALNRAKDIHNKLANQSGGKENDRMGVAIRRWMESRPLRNLVDDSIRIRTALENLFVDEGPSAELSLRVALRGAWYLGNDAAERRRYYDIIRRAYLLGSKAVHQGELPGNVADNRQSLEDALSVCRKAILKRLDDGDDPDWTALVLGS